MKQKANNKMETVFTFIIRFHSFVLLHLEPTVATRPHHWRLGVACAKVLGYYIQPAAARGLLGRCQQAWWGLKSRMVCVGCSNMSAFAIPMHSSLCSQGEMLTAPGLVLFGPGLWRAHDAFNPPEGSGVKAIELGGQCGIKRPHFWAKQEDTDDCRPSVVDLIFEVSYVGQRWAKMFEGRDKLDRDWFGPTVGQDQA